MSSDLLMPGPGGALVFVVLLSLRDIRPVYAIPLADDVICITVVHKNADAIREGWRHAAEQISGFLGWKLFPADDPLHVTVR